jgi:hypothetical protein
LLAAAGPRALEPASGGLWRVSRDARGADAQAVCIADPIELGQWQHRGERCEHTILSDRDDKTVIDYSCGTGGFGRSEVTLFTPRTLRVATQGIAGDGPFNYVIHARRMGNCPRR